MSGRPSRPASAQAVLSASMRSLMSVSRGVVIQPSALAAIQAKVLGPAPAPMISGMCGWVGLG